MNVAAAPLLALERVTMQFGGLKAVADLDLRVEPGELVGLIGPNGAGKTTVFNVITGAYAPTSGRIVFEGAPISGLKPSVIARRGITRTFQNIRLFTSRCCRDNVLVAAHSHARARLFDALVRNRAFADDEREMRRQADELLGSPRGPTRSPPSCRTDSSGGWRSPARWPAGRDCSCWTSPPRVSIRRRPISSCT